MAEAADIWEGSYYPIEGCQHDWGMSVMLHVDGGRTRTATCGYCGEHRVLGTTPAPAEPWPFYTGPTDA